MSKQTMDIIQFIAAVVSIFSTLILTPITIIQFLKNNKTSKQRSKKKHKVDQDIIINSNNTYEKNINSKNKYEYHEHKHYHQGTGSSGSNSSNDLEEFIGMALFGFVIFVIILYNYLKYQNIIIGTIVAICGFGLGMSTIVALFKREDLEVKNILYLIISWVLLFIPILFIKFALCSSSDFNKIVQIILSSNGNGLVPIVWDLFTTNTYDILYLSFQVLGLVAMLAIALCNIIFIYRSARLSYYDDDSFVEGFIKLFWFVYLMDMLLVTGLYAKIITLLQHFSKVGLS